MRQGPKRLRKTPIPERPLSDRGRDPGSLAGGAADDPSGPKPTIIDALEPWLRERLALVSQKSKLADALRYLLARWAGLCLFLDDGRVEIDSNAVERSVRPLAVTRKNALFAGSDGGAEHWAVIASLVEKPASSSASSHTPTSPTSSPASSPATRTAA